MLFLRQNLYSIPTELMEAAKLDGCSYFGAYWRIFLPLMKGALGTQLMLRFMGIWNDYLAPTIFLRSEANWTLQVVIRSFNSYYAIQSDYALIMAASVIAMIPTLLLFFIYIRFWSVMGEGMIQKVMLAVSYALAGILFMVFTWLFPVIAKMKDSLKNQFANAAKMAVGYFVPYTLLCLLIQGAAAYLAVTNVAVTLMMAVIGFAIVSYMCSFFFYKVFAKHITEESMGVDDLLYQERNEDEEKSGN